MPIGVIVNCLSLALGGIAGCAIGGKISEENKQKMNWIFGICAFGMGISSVILMKNMPAVVFAVIIGTWLGLLLKFGAGINKMVDKTLNLFLRDAQTEQRELMLTAVVLFCASGTGIYGALDSGMTGNHSILIAKSVLDFFTAMIFACSLGKVTSAIAIPQFLVMMALFFASKLILPLTTDTMILDFKACGGFLLLATGMRMMQLRAFPIADMIPAMVIVMPVSYAWSRWILPLIG